MTNVLISSLSKKVPLVEAVKKALRFLQIDAKVIGADTDKQAVGRFFVDQFWHMPPLDSLSINDFIEFCKKEQIRWIIPTRDGELLFYSTHAESLKKEGIDCMVSSKEAISKTLDKLLFYQTLSSLNKPVIPTYVSLEDVKEKRIVVKERWGAGSLNIGLDLPAQEASSFAKKLHSPLFQPFIEGEEFSVDLFVDKQGKCLGKMARKREKVIDGESQITYSVSHPKLEALCETIAHDLGIFGHAVFQAIDKEEHIFLIEANLRFGGASTLSLAMGLDSFVWFFLNEGSKAHPFLRSPHEKCQIRYPKDLILNDFSF